MKFSIRVLCVAMFSLVVSSDDVVAGVSYTGGTYTQNFDSLASTGASVSWSNDSTLSGWSLFRQPAPGTAVTSYATGSGTSTAGGFYSFGTNSSDRALGGLGSGGSYFGSPASNSIAGWIAFSVTNQTGSALSSFTVNFNGEQWRNGGNSTAHTMVLEYGFGNSFTDVANWSAPGGSFNWTSVVNTNVAAAVNGNVAGKVANVGGTIDLSSALWNQGQTLFIRWVERNDAGNDHALAIDDFSFSAAGAPQAVPEPSTLFGFAAFGLMALLKKRRQALLLPQLRWGRSSKRSKLGRGL